MRYIRKQGEGGYYLKRPNTNPPQTKEEAARRWNRFGHKKELLQKLLSEQYQLCCYSEIRADLLGLGYHIEHIENKSQNPTRTFDYNNLAASALASNDLHQKSVQQQGVFGGHAPGKQQIVDMQRFISPCEVDCARFFAFLSDGRIVPNRRLTVEETDRALYTINLLNLNSPFLLTERRKWWDELEELITQHLQDDMDLHYLAKVDLTPSRPETLHPFFSLTRQLFGPIAEKVLQQHAPELV